MTSLTLRLTTHTHLLNVFFVRLSSAIFLLVFVVVGRFLLSLREACREEPHEVMQTRRLRHATQQPVKRLQCMHAARRFAQCLSQRHLQGRQVVLLCAERQHRPLDGATVTTAAVQRHARHGVRTRHRRRRAWQRLQTVRRALIGQRRVRGVNVLRALDFLANCANQVTRMLQAIG